MNHPAFGDQLPSPQWVNEAEPIAVSPKVVPAPKRYLLCAEDYEGVERILGFETWDKAEEAFQDCVSRVDNFRDLKAFDMKPYNVVKVSLLEYDGELIKAAIWG